MQNAFHRFPVHLFETVPGGIIVERDPAALLHAIEPVLILLVVGLDAARFPDVENLVAVRVRRIEVGGGALALSKKPLQDGVDRDTVT